MARLRAGSSGGTSTCEISGCDGPDVDLAGPEQDLVQLLPRPQAGELDADGSLRAGRDQAGHLGDRHRLAHVEHQRLPRPPDGAGLDHQLDRLLDGHEEAGDVGVGDGDRPAALDLVLEGGEHRAAAAQDVAEPDAEVRGTAW